MQIVHFYLIAIALTQSARDDYISGVFTTEYRCGSETGNMCDESYCCSEWGYCGQTSEYCENSRGCQSGFGLCWETPTVTVSSVSTTTRTRSSSTTSISITSYSSSNTPAPIQQQTSIQQPNQPIQPQATPVQQYIQPPSAPQQAVGGQSGQLTWYTYSGGLNFCEEITRSEYDLVVAVGANVLQGKTRCGRSITITADNGRSVRATIQDKCAGCSDTHIDGTQGVWSSLGIDLGRGVVPISFTIN